MFGTSAELLELRNKAEILAKLLDGLTRQGEKAMFIISVGHNDKDGKSYGTEGREIRECVRIALETQGPGKLAIDAAQVINNVVGFCDTYGTEQNSIVLVYGTYEAARELAILLRDSQRQACVALVEIQAENELV